MAEKKTNAAAPAKKPVTRSPNYPFINLQVAIERIATLFQRNGRHGAGIETLAGFWGYGAKSSGFRLTLAALRAFGLIEGADGDGHGIRVSALGLDILVDYPEGSVERNRAIKDAARRPKIHAELWARYGATLPADDELRRYLVRDREFNDNTVDDFIREYKETLAYANLTDSDMLPPAENGNGGGDVEKTRETKSAPTPSMPHTTSAHVLPAHPVTPLKDGAPFIHLPLSAGNTVELRLRDKFSPEEFEAFLQILKLSKGSLVDPDRKPFSPPS